MNFELPAMSADPKRFNPWPLGIVLAFVVFGLGTAALIVLASSQRAELVSRDYYEQEIRFQKQMERQDRATQLGTNAAITFDPARGRITITVPPEHARPETQGAIHLYRPSAAGLDRHFALKPDSQGVQILDTAGLLPGLWKVRVAWNVGQREYWLEQGLTNAASSEPMARPRSGVSAERRRAALHAERLRRSAGPPLRPQNQGHSLATTAR
ncbi:MAG: FixH family protein [Verrucomicrobia bacterium]|nr:FixH family protein [Verrucomicrobiota bacterium]